MKGEKVGGSGGSGCGGDVDTMKCDDGWVRRVGW